MNTIVSTTLYIVMGLCIIGAALLVFHLITLWKQRDEIGEESFQRNFTFLGLLIGLSIVLGIIAHFFGAQ